MMLKNKVILNIGGWYVGNSAVVEYFRDSENNFVIYGDLDFVRDTNGLFDYLESKSSLLVYSFFMLKRIVRALRRNLKLRLFRKEYNLRNINNQPINLLNIFYRSLMNKKKSKFLYILCGNLNIHQSVILSNVTYYESFSGEYINFDEYFYDYCILFVYRNPVEQFISLYNDGQLVHTKSTPFRMGSERLTIMDRYFLLSERINKGRLLYKSKYRNIIPVRFESFVSSQSYRDKISKRSGLTCFKSDCLEKSKKNIRQYRSEDINQLISNNSGRFYALKKFNRELR